MRPRINIEDAAGRSIEAVVMDRATLRISFADGTYSCIGIDRGYESCDDALADEDVDQFDELAVKAGIMSAEELAANRIAYDIKRRADNEARQRAEYERLKARFG